MDEIDFDAAFRALTGHAPFPWQRALYQRFVAGDFPSSCNLPTGLGKTSVIHIWLLALANAPQRVPRRLVYVVNRRTVVDQSTNEAESLRDRIKDVPQLTSRLAQLCSGPDGLPLAISTLRGQFADNREWSADPARPAVIAGTVDMIGSRLLFSGYGVGRNLKPLHAGFLGQDALLVHDEAHLEPAFQKLIEAIRDEQAREPAPLGERMRLRVMELTATSRGVGTTFGLGEEDRRHPEIQKRIYARKALHLHENADERQLADRLAELALGHASSGRAVLVFAQTVKTVEKVAERLGKAKQENVKTLTGTMRGQERDRLVEHPTFRRFVPGAVGDGKPAYLVCTSAGEVGVNISADDLVCDLSTFDSMAQRFGRVNRFGLRDDTRIDVVCPSSFDEKDDLQVRRMKTLGLLRLANGDGSPANLSELHDRALRESGGSLSTDRTEELRGYILATYAAQPAILPTSDILFDAWALTTIHDKMPGRPPVADWLHGVRAGEPPETHVAWRKEVGLVRGEALELHPPRELLEDYPLKPHELLRDRSDRVFEHLKGLARQHGEGPVWLVGMDGSVVSTTLGELVERDKEAIYWRTVLLPEVGGLNRDGMLGVGDPAEQLDVADEWCDEEGARRRARKWDDEKPQGMRLVRTVVLGGGDEDEAAEEPREWRWYVRPRSADDGAGSWSSRKEQGLDEHLVRAKQDAERIARALLPEGPPRDAVALAARWHDLGKRRRLWQRSIGNTDPSKVLAKSDHARPPEDLSGYRHELGSLLDIVTGEAEFQRQAEEVRDLILHLVAAHHGRARPHYPAEEVFDPERSEVEVAEVVREVPRRFARLQRRYGRWGLAYLESLVRAADYAASGEEKK